MFLTQKKKISEIKHKQRNISNYRTEELISELEQCREDERVCQAHILQSISAMLTVLGLFYGAYIYSGKNGDNTDYYLRIIFHASNIAFCAVFSFITTIGIEKNLRYYYIKDIEKRLYIITQNSIDDLKTKREFMHWNEYSAPIITRNPNHLKSFHSLIYWIYTSASILCPIFFCIAMIFIFFNKINKHIKYDYFSLYLVLALMISSFIIFIISALTAKNMANYSETMAYNNRHNGHKYNINTTMKYYQKLIKYLIYPKSQDLQKPLLIILGFIFYSFYSNNFSLNGKTDLFIFLIIFDFLAYQARYQINDIRGIQEDIQMNNMNRLPLPLSDSNFKIKDLITISFVVAILKIILAITITVFLDKAFQSIIFISLITLFINTILYEYLKSIKIDYSSYDYKSLKIISNLIIFFVGSGYPLRFFLGAAVASISSYRTIYFFDYTCIFISMWCYGVSSSLLVWITEIYKKGITKFNKYEKNHYRLLYNILYKNNYFNSNKSVTNFLRKKGLFVEIWNMYYIVSIVSASLIIISLSNNLMIIIAETITIFLSLVIIYYYNYILIYINIILHIFFTILAFFIYKNQSHMGYVFALQLLYNITFFILKYKPSKISIKHILNLLFKFEIKIIGQNIYNKYF